MPVAGPTRLVVFDLMGRKTATLVNRYLDSGQHRATWDGRDDNGGAVAAGVYLARLETEAGVRTIKVTLAR